jgi:hypothetical protein
MEARNSKFKVISKLKEDWMEVCSRRTRNLRTGRIFLNSWICAIAR